MKHACTFFSLLLWFCCCSLSAESKQLESHQREDSLSYQNQRQRVNDLLEERTKKFGQYSESLERKTGIFGLFKRKADMQHSIDILREIVLNDNHIFIETRKLLDLKDAQSTRYQHLATEFDQQISAYMKTITKLQNENENLRAELAKQDTTEQGIHIFSYFSVIVILVLFAILIRQRQRLKRKN